MTGSTASKPKVFRGLTSAKEGAESLLFPPEYADKEQAQLAVLHVIRRNPACFGIPHPRWQLRDIREQCPWLRLSSDASLCNLLSDLKISYKRGREYIHSPDPDYKEKLLYVDQLLETARASSGKIVLLYADELSYYRQPTLARAFEQRGQEQILARRSCYSNTCTRVVGVLNPLSGRVDYWQGSHSTVSVMVQFYQEICKSYSGAERIYITEDNWPLHFHPDLLVALQEQESPWPRYTPKHWPEEASASAKKKWAELRLPIQLVPLPTYASWTNPIEKLWRWLKQEILHMHHLAEQLPGLRSEVKGFLDRFATGSTALLQYVGLPTPD